VWLATLMATRARLRPQHEVPAPAPNRPGEASSPLSVGPQRAHHHRVHGRVVGGFGLVPLLVPPLLVKGLHLGVSGVDEERHEVGFSTWTVTGDGLLGHPYRAPYDRVIATCAVRRIPYTWIRQTKPGGIVVGTVGSWPWGTGLAKLRVDDGGTAEGAIVGRSSFMQARAQAMVPVAGDLPARTAYADSERTALVSPLALEEWMPAFLAQLAAPGAQFVRATRSDGSPLRYLFDPERESFAEFTGDGESWTVRQGGPAALWDDIERSLTAWQDAGVPDIDTIRLRVTTASHLYWIDRSPSLRWEHRLA